MNKLRKSLFVALLILSTMLMSSCGTRTYTSTEHIECTVTDKQHTTEHYMVRCGKSYIPQTSHYYALYVSDGKYTGKCDVSSSEYNSVDKGANIKVYKTIYYKIEDDSVDRVSFSLHI